MKSDSKSAESRKNNLPCGPYRRGCGHRGREDGSVRKGADHILYQGRAAVMEKNTGTTRNEVSA